MRVRHHAQSVVDMVWPDSHPIMPLDHGFQLSLRFTKPKLLLSEESAIRIRISILYISVFRRKITCEFTQHVLRIYSSDSQWHRHIYVHTFTNKIESLPVRIFEIITWNWNIYSHHKLYAGAVIMKPYLKTTGLI